MPVAFRRALRARSARSLPPALPIARSPIQSRADSGLAAGSDRQQTEVIPSALDEVDLPYSVVRPTWIFGGEHDILANNIAWILRHMPIFAIPAMATTPSARPYR